MSRRPRLARTSVLGALTALALSTSMLAATGTADGAVTAGEEFFAPRLVTVDTPPGVTRTGSSGSAST